VFAADNHDGTDKRNRLECGDGHAVEMHRAQLFRASACDGSSDVAVKRGSQNQHDAPPSNGMQRLCRARCLMAPLLQPVKMIGVLTASVVTISRFIAEIETVRRVPERAAAKAARASELRGAIT